MTAPPRDAPPPSVSAARDDPLGHVVDGLVGRPLAVPVQAVAPSVLRALTAGFLHAPLLAHWCRNAFTVGGRSLASYDVLERLLPRLGGAATEESALLSRQSRAQGLGGWVAALYGMCRKLLPAAPPPDIEGESLEDFTLTSWQASWQA